MADPRLTEVVTLLNRFLSYDPQAMTQLFDSRVPVKPEAVDAILADPTLIAGLRADGRTTLGPMGLINGLFGSRIAAVYESSMPNMGLIMRFELKDSAQ